MKKKFHRYWLWTGAAVLLLAGAAIWLVFAPFDDLSKTIPEGSFTSEELFREFAGDPSGTSMRLSGKVITLEGRVAATGDGYVMLGQEMAIIKCVFGKSIYRRNPLPSIGDSVKLKCVCRGLNLAEVLVTNCILTNKVSR